MHAVARLTLQRALPNIQASWVKMGPERAAALMHAGCNDMGTCQSWRRTTEELSPLPFRGGQEVLTTFRY